MFMSPELVADIGNSRIKWGRCADSVVREMASLPLDDPKAWDRQRQAWPLHPQALCVIAGVHPAALERLSDWLRNHGHRVEVITGYRMIPIEVRVEHPDQVGLDRLLNAVAAKSRCAEGVSAVLVDAGSAVTVDCLDERHAFAGGAILPGLRLMGQALRQYTAKLPLVPPGPPVPMPAASTEKAIAAGVHAAVIGGIGRLIEELLSNNPGQSRPIVYLTGGDAELLAPSLEVDLRRFGIRLERWPTMTLEGIRLSAARLP